LAYPLGSTLPRAIVKEGLRTASETSNHKPRTKPPNTSTTTAVRPPTINLASKKCPLNKVASMPKSTARKETKSETPRTLNLKAVPSTLSRMAKARDDAAKACREQAQKFRQKKEG
ncbi:hypothetical protein HDU76_011741, partial [Blyttiomyces sp. JEL0837]